MIYSALFLGLFGSIHCVGMCGPIALALPILPHQNRALGIVLYNLGRMATYSLFGLLMGILGQIVVIAGFQQFLSIVCGALMVLFVIMPSLLHKLPHAIPFLSTLSVWTRNRFSTLLKQFGLFSLFIIGLLNGLLPCGLLYVALAGAIATGNALQGALYMGLFGLGTAPLMFVVAFSRHLLTNKWKSLLYRYIPFFVALTGILLIVRGLNLGIPYVSPQITEERQACCKMKCH